MSQHRFDAAAAECLVFVRREGLLSPIGHDLKIRVTRFTIDVDENARRVDATFDARSLKVVCAIEGESDRPGSLSDADKRQIEGNIAASVLQTDRHPQIAFTSTSVTDSPGGYTVKGTLSLCGRNRTVQVRVGKEDGAYVAEARVRQPDFGIRPYSAMLGALRVKPVVVVRVRVRERG
jgi:hypothetical protein